MRSVKWMAVLSMAAMGFVWPAAGETLEIGSPAPKLAVSKWVKGTPVDLTAVKGKQITVIEFWATWCPPCVASIPHLTALQHEFADRDVLVLGITEHRSDNTLEKVTQFVKQRGKAMDYTVAFDAKGEASRAYMAAAEMDGIPTVFVVDQANRIAWIGYPDEGLDEVVGQLLAGTYDIDLARRLAKIDKRGEQAAMLGEWKDVIKAMDEALVLKPKSVDRWMQKFEIWALYIGNHDEAKKCARKAFELVRDDPSRTAEIASQLITDENDYGYNEIAMDALTLARASAPKNGDLRMAQFRILAAAGKEAEALTLASETLELLKGDAASLSSFAAILSGPGRSKKCGTLALRAVELAIKAEPDQPLHLAAKFQILRECKKDIAAATATGYYLIQKATGNADFLNGFAWTLLTDESTKGKFNALALAAAEAMAKAPGGDNWSGLDTLALAKFETGAVDEAIALETKAIKKCDSHQGIKATLESSLERFRESRK